MDKIESEMEQLAESLAKSTSQDVSETVEEDLEKAGKGPGSRGGKVIGHTKSGKPIYEDNSHAFAHKEFNSSDHKEAAEAHQEASKEYSLNTHEDRAKRKGHLEHAMNHMDIASVKEKHERKEAEKAHDVHVNNKFGSIHEAGKRQKPSHEEMVDAGDYAHMRGQEAHEHLANEAEKKGDKEGHEYHKKMYNLHGLYRGHGKQNEGFMGEAKKRHAEMETPEKEEKKMKKSEQIVLDAAMTLGREGLKKALPNLSDEQKELLHTVLEKAKAMSFDEEVKGPGAQVVVAAQEKVKVAKDHDEDHDADDEKLVKPAAADIKHQGDNSPEGIEGQMIKGEPSEEILQDRADMASKQKGKQDDKDAMKVAKMEKSCDHDDKMIKGYEMLLKSMPEELEKAHMGFDKLVEKLKTEKNPPSDPAAVAAAIGRKKYGKQAFQSMSKSAPLCKSCESEEKEPKMKSKIEAMKAKGLKKSECLSYAESKGYDLLAKGIEEFWGECTLEKAKKSEGKEAPMNSIEKEEEKEMEGQKAEAKKENASQKPPKKEDEKKEKMEKSIPWTEGTQALLKASTRRGQNAHYTVEAELLKSDAETREILKKGEYLNAEAGEEFMKSVRAKLDRKVSINDILEKGLDMSTEEVDSADRIAKAKPTDGSFNVKSFDEAELIKSMGLTQEQAEAIFKK